VVQLWGSSQWHLASPWQSDFLYGDENWSSPVNLDEPPLQRFPKLEQAQIQTFTLNAGEALFVPLLWWHQCRAIAPSGQIICTNFSPREPSSPEMTAAK
jgi:lysine-specific demethylase 8